MAGGNGLDEYEQPFGPIGTFGSQNALAKDLTGFDKKIVDDDNRRITLRKTFLTLTVFSDENEACAYAMTLHKLIKYQMWSEAEEIVMMLMARTSVKGRRSDQIVDILTQIQLMRRQADADKRASAAKPQQQPV